MKKGVIKISTKNLTSSFFTTTYHLWYSLAIMDFEYIIDSHSHWGPSITMGTDVTTRELLHQQEESVHCFSVVNTFFAIGLSNILCYPLQCFTGK